MRKLGINIHAKQGLTNEEYVKYGTGADDGTTFISFVYATTNHGNRKI